MGRGTVDERQGIYRLRFEEFYASAARMERGLDPLTANLVAADAGAALVGHGAAIRETARLTDRKIELTEEEKAVLDEKLCLLLDTGGRPYSPTFCPTERKTAGLM